MKRAVTMLSVVLTVACGGGQRSGGSAKAGAADFAAVVVLEGQLQAAAVANDWDAWSAHYTADAVRLPPNVPPLESKAAQDAFHRALPRFSGFTITLKYVAVRNDLAAATGTYTATTAPGKGAAGKATPERKDEGKWMQLLLKQPDGSWKINRDIWNSNLPAAGAATGPPK